MLLVCLLLAGCSPYERSQATVCIAVATAIAPDGEAVSVRSIEPLVGVDHALRVTFSAGTGLNPLFADCVFAGGPLEAGHDEIRAVRGARGVLSERELDLMRRWFLDQPGAVSTLR